MFLKILFLISLCGLQVQAISFNQHRGPNLYFELGVATETRDSSKAYGILGGKSYFFVWEPEVATFHVLGTSVGFISNGLVTYGYLGVTPIGLRLDTFILDANVMFSKETYVGFSFTWSLGFPLKSESAR